GGSTDPVTVTPGDLPAGVSASRIEIVGNTGNLNLSASRSAAVTYHFPVTVTATSRSGTAIATLTLSVSSSRFSLAVTPGSIRIKRRSAGTVTVTVSRENFPDVIEVTASGPPETGLTAETLLLSGNRGNLVVRADLRAPLGQSSLTVSAVSGSIRETASLQV